VAFKNIISDNKIYAIIAVIIIVIIILTVFFSSNQLNEAIIKNQFLGDEWIEDIKDRDGGSRHFGLEKWISYTYKNNDLKYPAYITVTSIKTLFMMGEDELYEKTIETIKKASDYGVFINESSKNSGTRDIKNGHKTRYCIFYGNDSSGEIIKIIGESWNCGISGTSVICIGVAQITNSSVENYNYWKRIISDKTGTFGTDDYKNIDGLIFNVKCH
jgi:hypothetical protein